MGFFKDRELEIIEMYTIDGMKETEIANRVGATLLEVHDVLAAYERGDMDYDLSDTDAEMVSYDDLEFEPSDSDE
jgi:transposase